MGKISKRPQSIIAVFLWLGIIRQVGFLAYALVCSILPSRYELTWGHHIVFAFSKPPVWRWIRHEPPPHLGWFSKPPVWRWIEVCSQRRWFSFSKPPVWRWIKHLWLLVILILSKPPVWRWIKTGNWADISSFSKPPVWRWMQLLQLIIVAVFSKPPVWRWMVTLGDQGLLVNF